MSLNSRAGQVPEFNKAGRAGGGGVHALRASPQGEGERRFLCAGVHGGREEGHSRGAIVVFVQQTHHTATASTYGLSSSSDNSLNSWSTPTIATEQFSFVSFYPSTLLHSLTESPWMQPFSAFSAWRISSSTLTSPHTHSPRPRSSLTCTVFVSAFRNSRDRYVFALWQREPIAVALYSTYSPEGEVWKRCGPFDYALRLPGKCTSTPAMRKPTP